VSTVLLDRPRSLDAVAPPEWQGRRRDGVRLLVSRADGDEHATFTDLPEVLDAGDLLVVNDSATLPASLRAHGRLGPFRLNLSTRYGPDLWLAEPRPSAANPGPMPWRPGDRIEAGGVGARLVCPYPSAPRLWFVEFDSDITAAMQARGEPIRYAYLQPPFPPIEAYQTIFARHPGSAEMPSAGRPFTRRVVDALRQRGLRFATVTLHAAVSSLEGDADYVDRLPSIPEPFHVPPETVREVEETKQRGGRVIAVGTTVVRALESAHGDHGLRAAAGFTRLIVHPGRPPRVANGLITGMHDPTSSHLALLRAFAGRDRVERAYRVAIEAGYRWHEFGDVHLVRV
jgi:S-adenosylmethionine:tRNA ribosyltransferase-isomerase